MKPSIKKSVSDLAAFGGTPLFDHPHHVGTPNIGDRRKLRERFEQILDTRLLSNFGPQVLELERRIAERTGVRHCITVSNGTVGLEIAARSLDLKGEVIVPAMTFVASAHALMWQEITPVFCDVDPDTHLLDPGNVESLITEKTTGILGVHLWGRPCDVDSLATVARSHGIRLMFDAAHAFGCSYQGRPVGSFGDVEVLSFHATKVVNSFEGGAILTNDDGLAKRIRMMTNFGFTGRDQVDYLGVNGKMSEIHAAMGLTSLESFSDFIAHNRRNYRIYKEILSTVPGISLRMFDEDEENNFQYIVIEIDENAAGISRDRMMELLQAENVDARRYFYPGCHRMEPYKSLYPEAGLRLPHTEAILERVLALPTGTAVSAEDAEAIAGLIADIVQLAPEIEKARR